MSEEHVRQLADHVGGTIEEMGTLDDGSGFAVMSLPLPEDHWIYGDPDKEGKYGFEPPPMPMRMGKGDIDRERMEQMLREAGKYAIRASTMKGKDNDFDPDALIQNLIVGMLGYHTPDGLSSDEWENPVRMQVNPSDS